MNAKRGLICLAVALACTACQPQPAAVPDSGAGNGTAPALPGTASAGTAVPSPPPPTAGTARVRYGCDDGDDLHVAYADGHADVTLPDGRTVTLPRAEPASHSGGDTYVGEALSLQVDDDIAQLHQDEGPMRSCRAR